MHQCVLVKCSVQLSIIESCYVTDAASNNLLRNIWVSSYVISVCCISELERLISLLHHLFYKLK